MPPTSSTGSGLSSDVVVIGGGAAGMSAAMVLARARRSVSVVDARTPRNAAAAGVHGLLGHDGVGPAELLASARKELEGYGARMIDARAVSARRTDTGFDVELDDGTVLGARRLIVATGLVDELPDVPGLRKRWGRDVLHCPYCHGWELRGQPLGVLASGPDAVKLALTFRQWSDDVVLFTNAAITPSVAEEEQLRARGVQLEEASVSGIEVTDDRLSGVALDTGEVVPRAALAVEPRLRARSQILGALGIEATDHANGWGARVPAQEDGSTSVPGVWVAGNVTDLAALVVTAASQGTLAGAAANADLVEEDTRRAVAELRNRSEPG